MVRVVPMRAAGGMRLNEVYSMIVSFRYFVICFSLFAFRYFAISSLTNSSAHQLASSPARKLASFFTPGQRLLSSYHLHFGLHDRQRLIGSLFFTWVVITVPL